MKASQSFISILRETPAETMLASHRPMIRAGPIKTNASGLYTQVPMGLRVLRKIENVARKEMARMGSVELLMPVIQPAELWQESGRWEFCNKELPRLKNRHDRGFCMGPTCEKIIVDAVRREISSYKQLPENFYHTQTRLRNEVRPRFGAMRAREFVMKDAYSFHADYASLQTTYDAVCDACCRIFTRLDLEFRPITADAGNIGGADSHEFQVLAEGGEDMIVYGDTSDYAANVELTPASPLKGERTTAQAELTKVHTLNVRTTDSLVDFLSIPAEKALKSIVVEGENEDEIVLLPLHGNHKFNDIKAEKLTGIKLPLTIADPTAIRAQFGTNDSSLGPVDFTGKVYADFATEKGADWVIGANEDDCHYTGFNFDRDAAKPEFVDLRNVVEGDESSDGQGRLKLACGIEVGHVLRLRDKYIRATNVSFLDNNGKSQIVEMGCYGIGITRVVAVTIEQDNDEKGIIWTKAMAPSEVIIVLMNCKKPDAMCEATDKVYTELLAAGTDVLLDSRGERAGVLLNDSELLDIPHRIVIGDRALEEGSVEYAERHDNETQTIPTDRIAAEVLAALR